MKREILSETKRFKVNHLSNAKKKFKTKNPKENKKMLNKMQLLLQIV